MYIYCYCFSCKKLKDDCTCDDVYCDICNDSGTCYRSDDVYGVCMECCCDHCGKSVLTCNFQCTCNHPECEESWESRTCNT